MKLKTPSNLKRFYYILKFSKQLLKTKQFIDLTDELHIAHSFNHMYVDAHGYATSKGFIDLNLSFCSKYVINISIVCGLDLRY